MSLKENDSIEKTEGKNEFCLFPIEYSDWEYNIAGFEKQEKSDE